MSDIGMGTATMYGSFLELIGLIGGAWLQERQNKEVRAESRKMRAEDIAREEERFQTQIGITREQMAEQKRESRRQWKWNREKEGYNRAMDFANRFNSVLNSAPQYRNQLINVWRSR